MSNILFRVQGILPTATREELIYTIKSELAPNERLSIDISIVPDPTDDTLVALVSFKPRVPELLLRCGNEDPYITRHDTICGNLCFDKDFYGLTQLYKPSPNEDVQADIIAVTGLDGHAYGSWKAKGADGKMWLRDYFVEHFPRCRTMIFGYDSKLKSSGIHEIVDYNRQLIEDLKQARHDVPQDRPIIFIAHSFGGIVVAQTLVSAEKAEPDQIAIYKATQAVMFFGTPHRGLLTDNILSIVDKEESPERHQLVQSIHETSDDLKQQLHRFIEIIHPGLRILSFYEVKKTKGLIRDASGKAMRNGAYLVTVDSDSALLNLPELKQEHMHPVDADHSSLVKFAAMSDRTYKIVRFAIRRIISELPSNALEIWSPPKQPEPDVIVQSTLATGGPPLENSCPSLPIPPIPTSSFERLTVEVSEASKLEGPSPCSTPAKATFLPMGFISRRRDRESPSRQHDLEFAAEIAQSLLVQVRKLQGLLSEREEEIKMLQTERFELYKLQGLLTERDETIGSLQSAVEAANTQLKVSRESESLVRAQNQDLESRIQSKDEELNHREANIQSLEFRLAEMQRKNIQLQEQATERDQMEKELTMQITRANHTTQKLEATVQEYSVERTTMQTEVDDLKIKLEQASGPLGILRIWRS